MFEQLFDMPMIRARHRAGPLAKERIRYLEHLANQGVPRVTLRYLCCYLRAGIEYLRLAERPGEAIPYAEVERQGVRWVTRSRKGRHKRKVADKTRRRFVRCL
jgi:hypothetical protein